MTFTHDDVQICRSAIEWYLHDANDRSVASFLRDISGKIGASQDLTEKHGLVLCRVLQEYARYQRGLRRMDALANVQKLDHALCVLRSAILSADF